MEGAESELIVPSGHPAHQDPKAIAEVRRILILNLRHSETGSKFEAPRRALDSLSYEPLMSSSRSWNKPFRP